MSPLFDQGENVSRGVSEPGDGRPPAAMDAFRIRLQLPGIVLFKLHATRCKVVDSAINIMHNEVQDGE